MTLSHMVNVDEEALICDLAETYHIFDYRSLPLLTVGIFACGLREDSRIMMKLSGTEVSLNSMLLSIIADNTSCIAWLNSTDGYKGINRPKSIVKALSESESKKGNDIRCFRTGKDFTDEWNRIAGGDDNV